MDILAIDEAAADAAAKYTTLSQGAPNGSNAAILMNLLAYGQENAVLSIISDSTGVTQSRWPYLFAQWLAQQFPAYTVNVRFLNATSVTFDPLGTAGSSTVIQTGTGTGNAGGPFVLDIYVAARSGTDPSFFLSNYSAMVPVTPHLMIVNYGHNSIGYTGSGYRPFYYSVTRLVQQRFGAQMGLIVMGQNPRAKTDSEYALHMQRNRAIAALASTEGYGFINATQAFLDTPNYASTLLNGDGVHPSDAGGSPLWAAEVIKHFQKATTVVPRGPYPRDNHRWIPAGQFDALSGSPVKAVINSQAPMWSFPAGADTTVIHELGGLPDSWSTADVYVFWTTPNGSGNTPANGNTRWQALVQAHGPGFAAQYINYQAPGAVAAAGSVTSQAQNAGAYTTVGARLLSNYYFPTNSRPYGLQIKRLAASEPANDTLAATAYLLGVLLIRSA